MYYKRIGILPNHMFFVQSQFNNWHQILSRKIELSSLYRILFIAFVQVRTLNRLWISLQIDDVKHGITVKSLSAIRNVEFPRTNPTTNRNLNCMDCQLVLFLPYLFCLFQETLKRLIMSAASWRAFLATQCIILSIRRFYIHSNVMNSFVIGQKPIHQRISSISGSSTCRRP